MSARVGIVDYGLGNRRSVQKAFEHVGADVVLTGDIALLEGCAGLVIPGVGAFPRAMDNLRRLGLIEFLRAQAVAGTPILGICLGMHLLFEASEEREPTEGLALLPGEVRWLSADGLRLPHIGWNDVRFERSARLIDGLPPGGCAFYHVHSLVPTPPGEAIIATAEYGERFATIVGLGNVAGVQFHPEKSSSHGLRLLSNFVAQCVQAPALA